MLTVLDAGKARKLILKTLRILALTLACAAVLIPLAYLVINSVKLQRDMYTVPPIIIPKQITFEHFQVTLSNPRTLRFITNSLIVTTITTTVTWKIDMRAHSVWNFTVSRFNLFKPSTMKYMMPAMLQTAMIWAPRSGRYTRRTTLAKIVTRTTMMSRLFARRKDRRIDEINNDTRAPTAKTP